MFSDRLLILVAFVVTLGLLTLGARLWVRVRDHRRQANAVEPLWHALETSPDGRPTIVAFSTPSCGVCRTAQVPALDALVDRLGSTSVRIIQVNAADRPHVANAFGILTVPTTVVLGNSGHVATTNNGFAPLDRLAQQVRLAASV